MPGSAEHGPDLDGLLRRVADGDADAFAWFYDATCARVYGMVLRVLRDPDRSEATTEQVYAQAQRMAAEFTGSDGSALAWLMTLAHRRAVEHLRAAPDRPEAIVGAVDALAAPAQVIDCLAAVPEPQRLAIAPAYYDGLTYQQVAARLSTSADTVKARLRDGMRTLGDCLSAL